MISVVPIPARVPLFAEPAGRPGDWWEPLGISASAAAAHLAAEADRRRLPVDLLVALLLEDALVVQDIADCGLDALSARATLSTAAERHASSGPGRLHTSYVRMLRRGEVDYERQTEARFAQRDIALPLRLHDAAGRLDLPSICQRNSIDQALGWEIAAATSGQFMREWALRALLQDAALS